MINKHTVGYHPSSSQLTSRIHPLRIFLEFFPIPVNSTMFVEMFQIYGVKITGKYIYESKNWICSFLVEPQAKLSPGFYHYPQTEGNYLFPPEQRFLKIHFSPAEKQKAGGRRGLCSWKKNTEIKPMRVLLTSFDKLHHFCNLYIFGFCFVVP